MNNTDKIDFPVIIIDNIIISKVLVYKYHHLRHPKSFEGKMVTVVINYSLLEYHHHLHHLPLRKAQVLEKSDWHDKVRKLIIDKVRQCLAQQKSN
jgi:hypothetical protein